MESITRFTEIFPLKTILLIAFFAFHENEIIRKFRVYSHEFPRKKPLLQRERLQFLDYLFCLLIFMK